MVRSSAVLSVIAGPKEGRQYDVQRLPNESTAQQMAAKAPTSKDDPRLSSKQRLRMRPSLMLRVSAMAISNAERYNSTVRWNDHTDPTGRGLINFSTTKAPLVSKPSLQDPRSGSRFPFELADFYAARYNRMPPLSWPSIAPPVTSSDEAMKPPRPAQPSIL